MTQRVKIIYEDRDLVVCHKMPGVPVQTTNVEQQDMVSLLSNYYARIHRRNTQVFIVHRLDQPVEGVMVFARNKRAANAMSSQFRERKTDKCYLALVEGKFEESSGILEDYLWRNGRNNVSYVVAKDSPGAKYARLRYEVEKVYRPEVFICQDEVRRLEERPVYPTGPDDSISLVRVFLETGRHHQIRVQMAHAGHPLLADKKYAQNYEWGWGYIPIALCSVKLSFTHPYTGEDMEFTVEPQGELFSRGN